MMTEPNTLREAIEKTLYEHVTSFQAVNYEETTDSILDAIIAALPNIDWGPNSSLGENEQGYRSAIRDIKALLESAKQNTSPTSVQVGGEDKNGKGEK